MNNFSRTPAQMVTDITTLPARSGTQYTNWDDGLAKADSTFVSGRASQPNLLIIATDGNPNKYGNPAQPSGNNQDAAGALSAAVTRADPRPTGWAGAARPGCNPPRLRGENPVENPGR